MYQSERPVDYNEVLFPVKGIDYEGESTLLKACMVWFTEPSLIDALEPYRLSLFGYSPPLPPSPPPPPLPPRLCLNCSSAQVTQVYLQPAKMCTEHNRVRGHDYCRRDRERRKRLIEQDQRKQRAQQGAFKVCASRTFTSRKEHSRINH